MRPTAPRSPLALALALLGTLLLLAACGGGATDTTAPVTPPPPHQPGPPASLTIVSGDAQSALPGSMLPVKLSVLVQDAAGVALSGVAVQFSVDSGGGSLSTTTVSTGTNGVAVSGDWTLGAAVGTQVVSAKTGTLSPARFHAQAMGPATQTLIDKGTIATGGGTLVYNKTGDPLDGFTITVPPSAYKTSTLWTVVADSTVKVPLPANFAQVGPVLVISNAEGYADSTVTLTMPMQVASTMGVAPFYYDSATNTFEGIPLSNRTATSATLVTRHFSRDLLAIPSNASPGAALRASMALGFGAVKVVWVKIPKTTLVGAFFSSFRPGVDNWEFVNNGDYIGPTGDCEGMSVSEMYYHFYQKLAGKPSLYGGFDLSLPNVLDNVQGIRFAGSVQGDFADVYHKGIDQEQRLIDQALAQGAVVEDLTSTWILMTLKLSAHPVLLVIRGPAGGHAVVAYSASSTGAHTEVQFADPNYPATGRTMTFESGRLTPVALSLKSGAAEDVFDKAYAVAVTANVPLSQIKSRYDEFTQQKAGADRYPPTYRIEYYDYLSDKYLPLTGTLRTTDANLALRHICPSCPAKATGGVTDQQPLALWNGEGTTALSATGQTENVAGTTKYYALLNAYTERAPDKRGFLDAIPFTVIYEPFTISDPTPGVKSGDQVTLMAQPGNLATTGSTYTWTVDDGTQPFTSSTKAFMHTYTKAGQNHVEVTLKDDQGKAVAKATKIVFVKGTVTISPSPIFASPGKPVGLSAVLGPTVPPEYTPDLSYTWSIFGPNGFEDYKFTNGPTLSYAFPAQGSYSVVVAVTWKSSNIAESSPVSAEVKVFAGAWRLTKLTLTSAVPRGGGFLPAWVAGWDAQEVLLARAVLNPSDAMIFLEDNNLFSEHAVYFQIAPPGLGANAVYYVPGSYFTVLARASSIQFSHYNSTGTLTTGNIDGEGYTSNLNVILLNAIQAQKNGTNMTGTIRIGPYAFGGERTYQFQAVLVTP